MRRNRAAEASCKGKEAVQRTRQQEKYGDRLMQIAIFVGHRPRPPSSPGASFSPFFSLSSFSFFSRGDIAAGADTTRSVLQSSPPATGLPLASVSGAMVACGIKNSIGAASSRRWIVRACLGGLLLCLSCYFI